jgi:hypothetical protein
MLESTIRNALRGPGYMYVQSWPEGSLAGMIISSRSSTRCRTHVRYNNKIDGMTYDCSSLDLWMENIFGIIDRWPTKNICLENSNSLTDIPSNQNWSWSWKLLTQSQAKMTNFGELPSEVGMKWSRDHVLTWCFMYVNFTDLLTAIEFT